MKSSLLILITVIVVYYFATIKRFILKKTIQLLFMNLQKILKVAAHSSDINQYRNHEKEKQLPTKSSFIVTKF
jgi:hypothetical protein